MRITALVKERNHVCCRYRLAAYQPFLEKAGHQLEIVPWPRNWWLRWRGLRSGRTDVIILQRRLPSARDLEILRQSCDFLVFDFDDAVFMRDSFSARGVHSNERAKRFTGVVRAADAVVAGNSFLAQQAALRTVPERIHVIPTYLNPDCYRPALHRRERNVQVVWIGSASTLAGLERARPMLEKLGRRRPELQLKLICDRFITLEHLPVIGSPWSEDREAEELAAADIGLSWLPDDLWSRGKCGLKVLQYMAAGLPVIANPVGIQAELVQHGQTGFLAATEAEFEEAVDALAGDIHLRSAMGRAGRAFVEAHFPVSEGASRWIALLDGLNSLLPPFHQHGIASGDKGSGPLLGLGAGGAECHTR